MGVSHRRAVGNAPASPPPPQISPEPDNPGESHDPSEPPDSPKGESPSELPPSRSVPAPNSGKGKSKKGQTKSSSSSTSSTRRYPVGQPYQRLNHPSASPDANGSDVPLRRSTRGRKPPGEWWKVTKRVIPPAVRDTTSAQVSERDSLSTPSSTPDPIALVPSHSSRSELKPATIKEVTPEIGISGENNDDNDDSDDDELEYVDAVEFMEELDDGHEDMYETAMQTCIETGLEYLATEECELSLVDAIDFVLAERAQSCEEYKGDPKTLKEALKRDDAHHW